MAGDYQWQMLPPEPLVFLIPVANLAPVSTTLAANIATSTAGVVDIGIKDLKVNLKEKIIYMLTLLPKGVVQENN
jgi:hypothetical protein